MSKVKEFLQKAAKDKALQEKVAAIMEGKPEEINDKIVTLAKENGFAITFDEFLKELKGQEGEVSDDELDKVVGGAGYWDFNNPEEVARLLALYEERTKEAEFSIKGDYQAYIAGAETAIEEGMALLQDIAKGR